MNFGKETLMFRKSIAVLLAFWFPLSFSLQGCGRGSSPIPVNGNTTIDQFKETRCTTVGKIDTDGDGICDPDDTTTDLEGPFTSDTVTSTDGNGNGIPDNKDGNNWWHSNWEWVVSGLAMLAVGWFGRGAADGNTWYNPFDFGGDGGLFGKTIETPTATLEGGELEGGVVTTILKPSISGSVTSGVLLIKSTAQFKPEAPLKMVDLNGKDITTVVTLSYCLKADYKAGSFSSADKAELELELGRDYLKTANQIGSSVDLNAFSKLCSLESPRKGMFIAFQDADKDALYSLETLPLAMMGFKPKAGDNEKWNAESIIVMAQNAPDVRFVNEAGSSDTQRMEAKFDDGAKAYVNANSTIHPRKLILGLERPANAEEHAFKFEYNM